MDRLIRDLETVLVKDSPNATTSTSSIPAKLLGRKGTPQGLVDGRELLATKALAFLAEGTA